VIRGAVVYLADPADAEAALLPVAHRPVGLRAVMAAVRAGCAHVAVPAVFRGTALADAIAAAPAARRAVVWLERGDPVPTTPQLLLPAVAAVDSASLAALARTAPGTMLHEWRDADVPIVVAPPALLQPLWPALAAGVTVGERLRKALSQSDAPPPVQPGGYACVRTPTDADEAETRLYAGLGSPIDTALDRAFHRRLSRPVTRVAAAIGLTPNAVTLASLVLGLAAALAFATGTVAGALAGLLLYVGAVVLDHTDGEIARLTFAESRFGELLDITVDTVVHGVLALALGLGAERAAGGRAAWLGLAAAAGIVASALVTWRWPEAPGAPGRRAATIGSRDGYYAMLLLFLAARLLWPPALTAVMLLIAVGSHAYWIGRLARRAARAAEH
jgi:phosphatidylglycerophosphate synthase